MRSRINYLRVVVLSTVAITVISVAVVVIIAVIAAIVIVIAFVVVAVVVAVIIVVAVVSQRNTFHIVCQLQHLLIKAEKHNYKQEERRIREISSARQLEKKSMFGQTKRTASVLITWFFLLLFVLMVL